MNINQDVKIKILPKGLAILEQERLKYGKFGIDAFPLIVEKDGLYLKLSMWEMMYLFGKEMYQGNNNLPFSPNFEVENE